ncbi:MAG: hypothetical protein RL885_00730 [Planctomycetota bacterium]
MTEPQTGQPLGPGGRIGRYALAAILLVVGITGGIYTGNWLFWVVCPLTSLLLALGTYLRDR